MPQSDPLQQVRHVAYQLEGTAGRLREDATQAEEPLLRAMFDAAAQVLDRLVTAFRTYERERAHLSRPLS